MAEALPKVFISSKIAPDELAEERKIASEVIEQSYFYPILFEKEPGSPTYCQEWWREQVRSAEVFLLLLDKTLRYAVFDEFKTARNAHPETYFDLCQKP